MVVILVLWAVMMFTSRDVVMQLRTVVQGIAVEFRTPSHMKVTSTGAATLTLPVAAAPDSLRREFALRVASYAHAHYVPELTSVAVQFVDYQTRGAMWASRAQATFVWSRDELRDTALRADSSAAPGRRKISL